jgi:hypothetical protein
MRMQKGCRLISNFSSDGLASLLQSFQGNLPLSLTLSHKGRGDLDLKRGNMDLKRGDMDLKRRDMDLKRRDLDLKRRDLGLNGKGEPWPSLRR